jgi:hypothetical protein
MTWYSPTRNRTLLQIGLVAVIASLLASLLLQRAERLAADAEALALELSLQALRNGAQIEAMRLQAVNGNAAIATLQGGNPALWAEFQSEQYLGVLDAEAARDAPRGSWYFDAERRELVYTVRHRDHFRSPGGDRVRLRAELEFADRNGDGRYDPVNESARGIRIEAVEPYTWRP